MNRARGSAPESFQKYVAFAVLLVTGFASSPSPDGNCSRLVGKLVLQDGPRGRTKLPQLLPRELQPCFQIEKLDIKTDVFNVATTTHLRTGPRNTPKAPGLQCFVQGSLIFRSSRH